jgi:hypothetical protein
MAARFVLMSLVVAAALAGPTVAAARPFQGTVGPGTTISLKRANGTNLKHTSPGEHASPSRTRARSTTSTCSAPA